MHIYLHAQYCSTAAIDSSSFLLKVLLEEVKHKSVLVKFTV